MFIMFKKMSLGHLKVHANAVSVNYMVSTQPPYFDNQEFKFRIEWFIELHVAISLVLALFVVEHARVRTQTLRMQN